MTLPEWHPHLDVWLLIMALVGGYAWALRRLGPSHAPPGTEVATARHVRFFVLAMVTIWVAADWPIHDLSEDYLFSVHMVQHLLLSLVAAPLLLMSIPEWLLRLALRPRPIRVVAGTLTRPFFALVIFNGVILLTHWPVFVEAAVRSEPFHFGAHAVLFGSAMLMWWPVLSPIPELPPLAPPARMFYLFLQSIVPTVPASFLTFGSEPLYPVYAAMPRIWGISAMADMRVAGLIMKIVGGAILWTAIAVIFFRWHAEEQRTEGWDALEWRRWRNLEAESSEPRAGLKGVGKE